MLAHQLGFHHLDYGCRGFIIFIMLSLKSNTLLFKPFLSLGCISLHTIAYFHTRSPKCHFTLGWVTLALGQLSAMHQPEKLENYLYEEVEIKSTTMFSNLLISIKWKLKNLKFTRSRERTLKCSNSGINIKNHFIPEDKLVLSVVLRYAVIGPDGSVGALKAGLALGCLLLLETIQHQISQG